MNPPPPPTPQLKNARILYVISVDSNQPVVPAQTDESLLWSLTKMYGLVNILRSNSIDRFQTAGMRIWVYADLGLRWSGTM